MEKSHEVAQAEQQEAPPGWAPCSPDLLKSGVCCESAPRIAGRPGSGVSHYHPAPKQEAQGAQAGEFQREDRYIVIKRKDLEKAPALMAYALQVALDGLHEHLPKREYLVIESDWPEYEPTWAAIQVRMNGQGAQAGDERAAFEAATRQTAKEFGDEANDEGFARDCSGEFVHRETMQLHRICQLYRAALATQPAAGEPVDGVEGFACWLIDHCEGYEIFEEKIQEWVADYLKSEAYQRVAAPPAAAHGDEAVRRDAERYRWLLENRDGMQWENMLRCCDLEGQEAISEFIDAAMRAQGEGEAKA